MREISDIKAIISTGDYTFEFTDSVDTDALTARLINEGTRIRLEVTPKYELGFELLQICFNVRMSKNDRAFLNGYQSWTDSREYEMHEKMRGIDHLPKAVVRKFALDKYGDYNFAVYSKKAGDFHGFSYGYLREGEEFTLFGSLNERNGFTLIETSYDKKLVCFSKDCEGKVYSDTFTALDVSVMTGSENEVFDRFFELSGIKCRQAGPLSGYTSWYRHYQDISEEKLLHDLEGIAANKDRYDIFQIDDGFQKGVGDWLKTDAGKFPHGMKYISDRIHGQGLMSGLWLAPFVCEKNSYIYRHRQDMLLKDENGEPVAAGCNWSGSFALDIYNQDVRDYLTKVFDSVLNKWGFDLVKLDFLYACCIIPHHGKTRGEIMADGMAFLRELAGDKLILGCGVPLASAFGVADYCRIGCDVGLDWNDSRLMQLTHRERVSTKNSVLNTIFRRQLDKRAFLNDPDVFLLRDENISLSGIQKQALAIVNDLFGSVYFTSDDVSKYSEKQRRILEFATALRGCEYKCIDITNGWVRFTYIRDGKEHCAELTPEGMIKAVRL